MKAEATAFMYDRLQLNVTRPEPIGYLCLSVSMPAHNYQEIGNFVRIFSPIILLCQRISRKFKLKEEDEVNVLPA